MNEIESKILEYSEKYDTDILVYYGDIKKGPDDDIINACRVRKRRRNVLLFLGTYGGDPNAAYRIARCLQEAYNTISRNTFAKGIEANSATRGEFSVLVDSVCKSAGTLICLGANKILMSGNGELGPIDMQLRKQDEVGESTSGLTPIQAVQFLENRSTQLFKKYFIALRFGETGFSTKMAAEVAVRLTTELLTPICQQIDPLRLAEVDRSLRIATEYGHRLQNNNLHEGALEKLLATYPSHGFVIDRAEAKKIFHTVNPISNELRPFVEAFRKIARDRIEGDEEPLAKFLSPCLSTTQAI